MNKEFLINQRRRIEETRRGYADKAASDQRLMVAAQWETQSSDRMDAAARKRHFQALRNAHHQALEAKRDRLACILAAEEAQYAADLASMQPTAADQVAALQARADTLAAARKAREQAFAAAQKDRIMRASSEPLRDLERKQFVLEVAAERAMQMGERAAQRDRQREEDAWYVESQQRALAEANAKEAAASAARSEYAKFIRSELDRQIASHRYAKQSDVRARAAEFAMMKAQWDAQKAYEAQSAAEDLEKKRRIRELARVEQANAAQRKAAVRAEDAQRDAEMLHLALAAEEAARQREEAYAEMLAQEAKEYRAALVAQMAKQADDDRMVEQLRKEQNDEAWAKRERVWQREAEQRARLMQEVKEERERQVAEKMQAREARKEWTAAEGLRIAQEAAQVRQMERALEEKRRRAAVSNAAELKSQMEAKQRAQAMEQYMEQLEREAERRAEQAYEEKLAEEMRKLKEMEERWRPAVRKAQAGERPF